MDSGNNASYESYEIETQTFKGPLEVLLTLIEKRKLLINDISLAHVADEYVLYAKKMEEFPMALTAHFLFVASTLILIKSRSLLPSLALTQEEQIDIESLEKRLKEYKRMQELSRHIEDRYGKTRMFARIAGNPRTVVFTPSIKISIAFLYATIKELLANLPKSEKIPTTMVKKVISLEEMLDRLRERIRVGLAKSFHEFAGIGKAEKIHVVVSFLAMLELTKQGLIAVHQRERFSDIHIETQELRVPHYG